MSLKCKLSYICHIRQFSSTRLDIIRNVDDLLQHAHTRTSGCMAFNRTNDFFILHTIFLHEPDTHRVWHVTDLDFPFLQMTPEGRISRTDGFSYR